MAFSGYLLAFGGKILPHEYIQLSTYEVLPYQRTELAAYRDNNNDLHRTTSSNHKTTIRFTTVPVLNRQFGWASPYTSDSNKQRQTLTAAELPQLDHKAQNIALTMENTQDIDN